MTITFRSDLDTPELVKEIEYLSATDNAANIARRLGFTIEGITDKLRREGYLDVVAQFDRERSWRNRRKS